MMSLTTDNQQFINTHRFKTVNNFVKNITYASNFWNEGYF